MIIIFGAGGDLTARKLIPALFHLFRAKLLPDSFAVVGLDRQGRDDDSSREHLNQQIRSHVGESFDQAIWDKLAQRIHYMQGNIKDRETYDRLVSLLNDIDQHQQTDRWQTR